MLLALGAYILYRNSASTAAAPQYQTAKVERGTLVSALSGSGTVSSANSTAVTTEASGVVRAVYVKNGEHVVAGAHLFELELDGEGKARLASAWASYLSSKSTVETTQASYYSLRSSMLTKWKTYMEAAESSSYENADGTPRTDTRQLPQFISTSDDWLFAEASLKNQETKMTQAKAALNSSWLAYQKAAATVTAPVSGIITGLSLQNGNTINATSNSNGGASSQKIASVLTGSTPLIAVNITEIDVPKIKIGNRATVKIDAFPDKTYTGSVVSIDTTGVVSSGVTTYPTVIKLDSEVLEIFANMGASANIILESKDNVLMLPSGAIQTQNGETSVRVLNNGQVSTKIVQVGITSDTQTEIVSGLAEGDEVVTSVTSTQPAQNTTSVFSAFGGRNFGGGAQVRVAR